MSNKVRIIASCSERKRMRALAIRLRDVPDRQMRSRVACWWQALERGLDEHLMPARRLYQGEHWSIVRDLDRGELQGKANSCELWVASAGYGLVAIDTHVHPYAATFATRHEDSVATSASTDGARAKAENRAWWLALSDYETQDTGAPRSIAALAADHPQDLLVVVGSPSYINAMEDDLLAARRELTSQEKLIIVSSAPLSGCQLKANWVTTSARLQPTVGGSLNSLNARIARKILRDNAVSELCASHLRAHFARAIENAPLGARPLRRPMADAQIAGFIRRELAIKPEQTHTRLLRLLRDRGWSCEQRRFKQIYHQSR